jgi:transposase InsO family protein
MKDKGGSRCPKPESVVRTTLVLPDVLDRNLEVWCAMNGRSKGDAVKEALTVFLTQRGLRPNKRPRVEISY